VDRRRVATAAEVEAGAATEAGRAQDGRLYVGAYDGFPKQQRCRGAWPIPRWLATDARGPALKALQAVGTVHAALLSERTELRDALHRVRAHHANFLGQLDACFRQQVVTDIFTD